MSVRAKGVHHGVLPLRRPDRRRQLEAVREARLRHRRINVGDDDEGGVLADDVER